MTELFARATRNKLVFNTTQGLLDTEDLWDLHLTGSKGATLDDIAQDLDRQIKQHTTSFVKKDNGVDPVLQLKFDVVKYIIDVKLTEQEAAKNERERREKKQRILAAIERKQNEKLEGASLEELESELASL